MTPLVHTARSAILPSFCTHPYPCVVLLFRPNRQLQMESEELSGNEEWSEWSKWGWKTTVQVAEASDLLSGGSEERHIAEELGRRDHGAETPWPGMSPASSDPGLSTPGLCRLRKGGRRRIRSQDSGNTPETMRQVLPHVRDWMTQHTQAAETMGTIIRDEIRIEVKESASTRTTGHQWSKSWSGNWMQCWDESLS